jgi:hypothetical protein
MFSTSRLTTAQVLAVFAKQVVAHGGRVTDTFDDGRRLLTRSILPLTEDVRPGDRLRGGVALKAVEGEVSLYPYIFRVVAGTGRSWPRPSNRALSPTWTRLSRRRPRVHSRRRRGLLLGRSVHRRRQPDAHSLRVASRFRHFDASPSLRAGGRRTHGPGYGSVFSSRGPIPIRPGERDHRRRSRYRRPRLDVGPGRARRWGPPRHSALASS